MTDMQQQQLAAKDDEIRELVTSDNKVIVVLSICYGPAHTPLINKQIRQGASIEDQLIFASFLTWRRGSWRGN